MPTASAKSIRQISNLQPWLLLTSLLLVCILGTWGMHKTRINGPLYREIATAHTLVGDILPPPLYIVEPYLSSVRLALAPAASQPLQSRLAGEIALYREKKAEWQDARLPPEIRAELFERSLPAADRCIELIENQLLPLVRDGRTADAAALLPHLEQAFTAHRESISRLAELARRQAAAVEATAEQSIRHHLLLIAAALGLILGTTFLLSRRVSREISASVDTAVAAAEAVGGGRLKIPLIPGSGGNQEVGRILEALEGTRQTLARQIDALERNREALRRAKEDAEQASRVKGEFLSTVSHELRTPLNGILGMLQVVDLTRLDGDDRECIAIARQCTQKLAAIIGDMLLFADLRTQRDTIRTAPFNLLDCIRSVTFMLQDEVRNKGLTLTSDIAPDVPLALLGDPQFFERALRAVLENAVKFTQEGSVAVQVALAAGQCRAVDSPTTVCLRIAVLDSGPGLPQSLQGERFEAFRQGNGRSDREHGGTGLGLALAAALVESLKGSISARNRESGGAEFTLILPFVKHDLESADENGALPAMPELDI